MTSCIHKSQNEVIKEFIKNRKRHDTSFPELKTHTSQIIPANLRADKIGFGPADMLFKVYARPGYTI